MGVHVKKKDLMCQRGPSRKILGTTALSYHSSAELEAEGIGFRMRPAGGRRADIDCRLYGASFGPQQHPPELLLAWLAGRAAAVDVFAAASPDPPQRTSCIALALRWPRTRTQEQFLKTCVNLCCWMQIRNPFSKFEHIPYVQHPQEDPVSVEIQRKDEAGLAGCVLLVSVFRPSILATAA